MRELNSDSLKPIIDAFPFEGEITDIEYTDTGLINSTFVLTFSDGNQSFKYVLQKINTNVFKKPDELMSNIMNVTGFLRNKINLSGGNAQRETLTFLYTKDNSPYYLDKDGNCWRSYTYIGKCYTCDKIGSEIKAFRSGKAFGKFQKMLSDFPAATLFETIPHFHDTPSRYEALKTAVSDNISGRLDNIKEELDFAFDREKDASKLVDLAAEGKIPMRVTHNDTKINNLLFDSITNEAICVIDLDTIMPGLSLYDFGDSIRSGAVTSDENERDLNNYKLNIDLFKKYTEGFLSEAGQALNEEEVKNLAFSAKLMALECGVRFLTDYLNGDTYFKTDYPEHNLVRAHTQFKLVKDIEEHMDELNECVDEIYRRSMLEA